MDEMSYCSVILNRRKAQGAEGLNLLPCGGSKVGWNEAENLNDVYELYSKLLRYIDSGS